MAHSHELHALTRGKLTQGVDALFPESKIQCEEERIVVQACSSSDPAQGLAEKEENIYPSWKELGMLNHLPGMSGPVERPHLSS
jgi:hypothetical protein